MGENSQRVPNVLLQPPSVDFIQRRLPAMHPSFQGMELLQYDQQLKRFLSTGSLSNTLSTAQKSNAQRPGARNLVIPVRELVPAISAMEFWNKILGKAMASFKQNCAKVPKKIAKKPKYTIRDLSSWADIHQKLQDAKEVYDGSSKVAKVTKRVYRSVAGKSGVLKQITELVPDGIYVTPVKTAIEMVVDIVETAANFRELVRGTFDEDELRKSFEKVEIYLATFPGDQNIEHASVSLIACILKAVELAIAFFLSSTVVRVLQSLNVIVGEYMPELADTISDIPQKTQDVIDKANESNIVATQKAMDMSLQALEELLLLEIETGERTRLIATKADLQHAQGGKILLELDSFNREIQPQLQKHTEILNRVEGGVVALGNDMRELFDEMDAKFQTGIGTMKNLCERFEHALEASRPSTPVPQHLLPSSWPSPPPQPAQHLPPWQSPYLTAAWTPWALPPPAHHHQPNTEPYPTPQNPPRLPTPPPPEPTITALSLLSTLRISNIDHSDMESIMSTSHSVDLSYRLLTRSIVRTSEFRAWAAPNESHELLIKRNPKFLDSIQACKAVSLVAASLVETLRSRERYVSLVFFCRWHVDSDDDSEDGGCMYVGPAAMVRSFIAQLVEQAYGGYLFRQSDIDLEGVARGDMGVLCALLAWLVAYLPKEKTLVVIADGIDVFENGEDGEDLKRVMDVVLGLARGDRVVKVLATCPMGTVSIDEAFGDDPGNFLAMERLQIVSYAEDVPVLEEEEQEEA